HNASAVRQRTDAAIYRRFIEGTVVGRAATAARPPLIRFSEGVLYPHPAVVLAVAEIFGEDDLAAERPSCLDDRPIPVGDPESVAGGNAGEHQADVRLLDGEAPEGVD